MSEICAHEWLVDKLLRIRDQADSNSKSQWEALANHADDTALALTEAIVVFQAGERPLEGSESA